VPQPAEEPFGERVRAAIGRTGPLCVGVDPSPAMLARFGLADGVEGVRAFGEACVTALQGVVAALKPQVAFFERHGAAGMSAYEALVAAGREAGLLVIADAKRGDVGSTTEAYADAWFRGPLAADAVTATPYVGAGALTPMVEGARATRRGLIVLATSSNPEGSALQRARMPDGTTVEGSILASIARWNAEELGEGARGRLGSVGAVVGATGGDPPEGLGRLAGVVLSPGIGAQGATVADVARRFDDCAPGSVLPAVSRELLRRGPRGLRDAASRLRDELAAALG